MLASVLLVTGRVEPARYSIFAVPAYCVCAASLVRAGRTRGFRVGLTAIMAFAVASQLWWTKDAYPASAGAYEEAARFVLADTGDSPAPAMRAGAASSPSSSRADSSPPRRWTGTRGPDEVCRPASSASGRPRQA